MQKKDRILKASTEKVTFRGKLVGITSDISTQTLNTRRAWNDVFHPGPERK